MKGMQLTPALDDLMKRWARERDLDRRRGQDWLAAFGETRLQELEEALRADRGREVSVPAAAQIFGCSDSHIHSLIRAGKLRILSHEGETRRVRVRDVATSLGRLSPTDPAFSDIKQSRDIDRTPQGLRVKIVG